MEKFQGRHKCADCGELFRYKKLLLLHQDRTGHQGSEILENQESSLKDKLGCLNELLGTHDPSDENSLKDIAETLEWKMMQGAAPDLRVSPDFAADIDEFSRSLFESANLGKTWSSEIQYGFGHALGRNIVEWMWDYVQPTFVSAKEQVRPRLRLLVVAEEREPFAGMVEAWSRNLPWKPVFSSHPWQ